MTPRVLALALAVSIVTGVVHGQDADRIRTLYIAAAYEEALAAMPAPGAAGTEIEQFRALCLLALGREQDARATIARLIKAQPLFTPSSDDLSPKMQALFGSIRVKLLPDIVRETYATAKKHFEARNDQEALAGFQRTITLIDSLPAADRASLSDIRVLASEFKVLSTARLPKPVSSLPPAVRDPVPAAPAPVPGGVFVAATPVTEQLPAWNPPDPKTARLEFAGLVRVSIGTDGRVTSAVVIEPTHPAYDVAVLQAAKRWAYKPATLDGQPVASQKDIRLRLVPR